MTIEESLTGIINGLSKVSDPNGKYVVVSDINGQNIGKVRPEMFLYGNELVDMGLPSGTLWAKNNLGATSPTEYGWYFAWGDPTPHQDGGGYDFSQANYNASDAAAITTGLSGDNDMATVNLGKKWRLPSKEDFAELFNSSNTTNVWTTINGVNGRLVTSIRTTNTIFFPASGDYNGTSLSNRGNSGYYWSLSIGTSPKAFHLYFNSSEVKPQDSNERRYGFSVRPVM